MDPQHSFLPFSSPNDPLSPFRNSSVLALKIVENIQRAIDEDALDLPTNSNCQRGIRRANRIRIHMENDLPWEMREVKNQMRWYSPDQLLPDQFCLIVRAARINLDEWLIYVGASGKATQALIDEQQSLVLPFEEFKKPNPRQALALVLEPVVEKFAGEVKRITRVHVAHITGRVEEGKYLVFDDIIHLGDVEPGSTGGVVADAPPSVPVRPTIATRETSSEG